MTNKQNNPKFNLFLTYEEALENAREFLAAHPSFDSKKLQLWEDPHGMYDERITIRTDGFYPTLFFDKNLAEMYEVGMIDKEAKAALLWLLDRHNGFNPLELGQVIVGLNAGVEGDREVAIFAYLSREADCLRDFILEVGHNLVD